MKVIKINTDHYIQVDDSEIKKGDWVLDVYDNSIKLISNTVILPLDKDYWKKITHSTQPIEHSTEPFADGVQYAKVYNKVKQLSLQEIKELIGEVDVESMSILYARTIPAAMDDDELDYAANGFYKGYNQALEDNKDKKYTRNEVHALMCRAFEQGLKKADILEAGLEGKETDVECAWILTRHDSTPKTEWEVEYDENGKLRLKP